MCTRLMLEVAKTPHDLVFRISLRPAVTFLKHADQLVSLSGDDVEIVVGQQTHHTFNWPRICFHLPSMMFESTASSLTWAARD